MLHNYYHHCHHFFMIPLQTKASYNLIHSSLSAALLFEAIPAKILVCSFYLLLSALPSFTILELPFCSSNCPSIFCSVHDVSCQCPLFSFNFSQDVFNSQNILIKFVHIRILLMWWWWWCCCCCCFVVFSSSSSSSSSSLPIVNQN